MEVTRNVIADLLPAYLSDEASKDTRALVEAYLKTDPEFARRVEAEWTQSLSLLKGTSFTPPPDKEKEAFERTKKYLKARPYFLMVAILFTLLPLMVTFSSGEGVHFVLWRSDFPRWGALAIAAVCAVNAAAGWIGYARFSRRLRGTGF